MTRGLVASAEVTIDAPVAKVWDAFTNPKVISQYMFGTEVVSEWRKGAPIVWNGVWKGKKYRDKGSILELKRESVISYTHFSPLTGLLDVPENYHTVTVELHPDGSRTKVALSQDNNPDQEARSHSKKNWEMMLASLKELLEANPRAG
jgi:uncharacterized protein YndB with AHSA1/START domain